MKLYRYYDMVYSTCSIDVAGGEVFGTTPVQLECVEYDVVKETKCGYWIRYPIKDKWVSGRSNKRFAYPSKRQALLSFEIRKRRQIEILSTRLRRAQEALALGLNALSNEG